MKNKIIIITGEQGSGKTTFLQELLFELANKDVQIGGILAEGFWKNYERDYFELIDLKSNNKLLYCQREPKDGWENVRHFYINPVGQKFGESALDTNYLQRSDIVVIDEIGPFEIKGKGWAKSIDSLLKDIPKRIMIWVVRKSMLEEVKNHYKIKPLKIFNVTEHCAENVATYIVQIMQE
jgi:nucleoside-triphosphatase